MYSGLCDDLLKKEQRVYPEAGGRHNPATGRPISVAPKETNKTTSTQSEYVTFTQNSDQSRTIQIIIIIINPLTARVVGAPQMILQPVFSIFPCSPLPSKNLSLFSLFSTAHQAMDRPGVRQVPEGGKEQGKMEKTGCKIISGAPTTLAVNGLMMMIMMIMMMSNATTASPNPSFRMVGRGNAGWTTSKRGHP